ncbi:unnamed protein product [Staurois parvus]|uniref:Uncharacterized protein n=1 Tax=Staurois parvus TaxID=386267 RepID=A0ABN9GIZ6_9NEOB|nr:unnamed protein product [Staurois parvus]
MASTPPAYAHSLGSRSTAIRWDTNRHTGPICEVPIM